MIFVPVVLVVSVLSQVQGSEPTDYKTAFKRAQQDDKPLLVLVTATWCPPCRLMKQTTIPQMIEENRFQSVHFATVDVDKNPKDARNLIGSRGVPQLILYEKIEGAWQVRYLAGYHDVSSVETFLNKSQRIRTANSRSLMVGH
jgi:thiol-disulfide isomerase/thioredoxin